MTFYKDFNLFTQYTYAAHHFSEVVTICKNSSDSSRFRTAISELAIGILEVTPVIGLAVAYLEKMTRNNTIEKRIQQRELFVQERIATKSFQLQSLYFDTQSSDRLHCRSGRSYEIESLDAGFQEYNRLNNSYPDFQIFNLISELKEFKETMDAQSSDYEEIDSIILQLESAKQSAILVSEIVSSYSVDTKEQVREKLEAHLRAQIDGLNTGESIIIPSGYMNGNIYDLFGDNIAEGHSVTIKLVKTGEDTFSLRCFNTATDKHHKNPNKLNSFYPYIIENVKAETLLGDDFLNQLTHNSYRTQSENNENGLYELLQSAGDVKTDYTDERSYHTQGNISNCTVKSLRVWMHDELAHNPMLYNRFRSFKLQKTLQETRPRMSRFWGMFYTVPLAAIGGQTSNVVGSLFFRIIGFLFGATLRVPVSKATISQLHWYGEQIAKVREEKLNGKKLKLQKIPLHIFKGVDSLANAVKDLEAKTSGPLSPNTEKLTILYATDCANMVYHELEYFQTQPAIEGGNIGDQVLGYSELKAALKLIENEQKRELFLNAYLAKLITLGKWTSAAELAYDYYRNPHNPDRFVSAPNPIINSWTSIPELTAEIKRYTNTTISSERAASIIEVVQYHLSVCSARSAMECCD